MLSSFLNLPRFLKGVCDDPDDDKFFACALASGSNLSVVSGDRHLLRVSGYQNIEVLKPRDFLDTAIFDDFLEEENYSGYLSHPSYF